MTERLAAYMIPREFSFPEGSRMTIDGEAERGKLAEALS